VKYYPRLHTILVVGGFAEKIAVFCSYENYLAVEAIIKKKTEIGEQV